MLDRFARGGPGAGPIGIDLGSASVKAAQPAGDGVRTAVIPRDEPGAEFSAAEFERLAGALRRLGFRGSRVALGAPRSAVRTTTIDLPPNQPDELRKAVLRGELGQMHGLDPSSFELAAWPSPQPPRATPSERMMAAVLAHGDATSLLDAAGAAGLDVTAIVPPSVAHAASTPVAGLSVVLDMGWSGATVVACRGGGPIFERALAGTSLEQLCAQGLGGRVVSPATAAWALGPGRARHAELGPTLVPIIGRYLDAVASELRASIGYLGQCLPDDRPRGAVAIGGPATDTALVEHIEARCGFGLTAAADAETRLALGLSRAGRDAAGNGRAAA